MSEKNSQNNRQHETSQNRPDDTSYCDVFLSSQEDRDRSFSKLYHGDVSVLGKIWICTLRAFLLGFQYPSSGYTKTPKQEEKIKVSKVVVECPTEDNTDALLHNIVRPYVSMIRSACQGIMDVSKRTISDVQNEIKNEVATKKESIVKYFRGEENYTRRVQMVASGGMLGYLKPGGLPTRFFCAAIGLASTGMLCFPKETDATIREVSYFTGRAIRNGYYFMTDRKPPDDLHFRDVFKSDSEK
ncbi:uncharacterized protein LOC125238962 [Leguminivora glycinivorella]|uniref:uncharacterized protein LOC125238962 n=1 Tax=Leguminivora glycinivorella TaxID=1035111 RepID=UPI0020100202|nr:uncharacterized protein LOC125238962 [Leguminivora glycinivorella]